MRLDHGGSVTLIASGRGETWAGDLGVIASEGERPSASVYLTADECLKLARWLEWVVQPEPKARNHWMGAPRG